MPLVYRGCGVNLVTATLIVFSMAVPMTLPCNFCEALVLHGANRSCDGCGARVLTGVPVRNAALVLARADMMLNV